MSLTRTNPRASQARLDAASHGAAAGRRRPDDAVDRDAPAVGGDRRRRLDGDGGAARVQHDVARDQDACRARLRTTAGCSCSRCGWSVTSAKRGASRAQRPGKPVLHGEQHLDAAGAAARRRRPCARGPPRRPPAALPTRRGSGRRAGPAIACSRAPGTRQVGRGSDVDRERGRTARRRPSARRDDPRVEIELDDAVADEARAAPTARASAARCAIPRRVVAGDRSPAASPSTAHSALRARPASARCRIGLQREPPQHLEVAVAAADQQDSTHGHRRLSRP